MLSLETTMTTTILVVDDKASVRILLQEYLTEQGYRVVPAENGQEALYAARRERPDVILLDIMMPKMDGFQFLQKYRRERNTPVVILTAREEETDTVLGLELGADDYVIKPFRMAELSARIRAVLRRTHAQNQPKILRQGDIVLDELAHTVAVRDEPVSLTPIEFNLLSIFMDSPGLAFSRSRLVDLLAEGNFTGLERTLNVHIRNLRLKIEPDPANPQYIETVFGMGYRMRGPT